jgi:excisionase family DNA binding protein
VSKLVSDLSFPGRKVLCVLEVAERLGVTDRHIVSLIEEGRLGAINVGGGSRNFWRIPAAEFERFLISAEAWPQSQTAGR